MCSYFDIWHCQTHRYIIVLLPLACYNFDKRSLRRKQMDFVNQDVILFFNQRFSISTRRYCRFVKRLRA